MDRIRFLAILKEHQHRLCPIYLFLLTRLGQWLNSRFAPENAYVVETQLRRRLADLVVTERQWVATMVILVWVKLMDPLQAVFQDFFLLVKMIALMIGENTMPLL